MKISTCSFRPILAPCSLPNYDYQIDPYVGCEHHCQYCYALNQAETDWTEEVLVHRDIGGQLGEELRSVSPQPIYMGWITDPYQPCEEEYRQTRAVLELLLENGFSASILTKSDLIVRDIDKLSKMDNASASISIAFNDDLTRQVFEDNTKTNHERIEGLRKLREAGIRTSALLCPVLPHITDVNPLIDLLVPHTDAIWVYRLSIQQQSERNWKNVQNILSTHFPDKKREIEEAVLSEDHSYWKQLRQDLVKLREERQLDLRIHV